MATKNHFSNYENLFSAFRESISNDNSIQKHNIESILNKRKYYYDNLDSERKEIENFLKNPPKKALTIDTRKSQEFLPEIKKAEQELASLKSSLAILSPAARTAAKKTLDFETNRKELTKTEIVNLENLVNIPQVDIRERTTTKAKLTKAYKLLTTIEENIKKYSNKIKIDDENRAKIQNAENNLINLQNKLAAIEKDEKAYTRKAYKENDSINEEIANKKARLKQIIIDKKKLPQEIAELEKTLKSVPTSTHGSIEAFKTFLEDNNFSTVHADELYELYKNPSKNLIITKDEFKLRKQHPKRDKFVKKLAVPVATTAAAVGIASGVIAASNLIAGSKWAFITITSNPAVNFLSAALPGAAIGAFAAYSTIKLKDAFTKWYYNAKYGNAEKALNEPESSKLDELIEKIENTKDDILDLRTGKTNIFSRFGRSIVRTAKNIINRNRIHHVEKTTEQLVEKFNKINNNEELSADKKLEILTPIHELLSKINAFYAKDIKKSKIFAMLNCKEQNKNHSHKETIENLDIYAKLSMYLEKTNENIISKQAKKKIHKQVKTDLKKQNIVAERLLNGENVTNLVSKKYLELVKISNKLYTPKSKMISRYNVINNELKVTFADGKTLAYKVENCENITKVESVNLGKTLLITYSNGEQASISSTQPKSKINLNMAGEYKVYDKLLEVATIDYLVEQKGFNKDTIFALTDALKLTKFNKNGKEKAKPSAFMKTKTYKDNAEYKKIIEEVAAIIKNPNIVNFDYGFNAQN